MAARRAWVLNLDADVELAAPGGYTPTERVREAMRRPIELLRASLLSPGDVVVDDGSLPASAHGLEGVAFCPTPRALRLLRRVGAMIPHSPPWPVLRAANSRAFASGLGPTLPGGELVTSLEAAVQKLKADPPIGDAWRIKRAFGMAGRGQLVVRRPASASHSFLRAGMAEGGVQIEPNVVISDEYAIHGKLTVGGDLEVGVPVRQRCDARGAWLSTARLLDGEAHEVARALDREVRLVGSALASAGYFGPFGVDAFTYRGGDGTLAFQPRSEVNARYSMGFGVGFGRG